MVAQFIRYHVVQTQLGLLLVAGTQRGVCQLRFGEDRAQLESGLSEEFPYARLVHDESALAPWVAALRRYLDGATTQLEVPLDVSGSRFQRRVWEAICAIPYGGTRSYADLAAQLDSPRGARAVARACATNPVALAIPCHRVIGRRGELRGYRWGIERKRWLLAREREGRGAAEPVAATSAA
jgi:AraC family transcriptional regulator of adaptative response/methylated-DNA-[protein]-cysteine methyltransferase